MNILQYYNSNKVLREFTYETKLCKKNLALKIIFLPRIKANLAPEAKSTVATLCEVRLMVTREKT